jgi:hypothetical protein
MTNSDKPNQLQASTLHLLPDLFPGSVQWIKETGTVVHISEFRRGPIEKVAVSSW